MRSGYFGLHTDGPIETVPPGLACLCLFHSGEGGARAAAKRNEVSEPTCVCRVKGGRRLQIEVVEEAREDLIEIARRLRAVA